MRALLHIPGDKALEVFNRAIGMKEVNDIDAFVRQFMLPSADSFAESMGRDGKVFARFQQQITQHRRNHNASFTQTTGIR
jgi:uncharacterized protein YPO0396